jgi:DNA-binding response OmpR family regulator
MRAIVADDDPIGTALLTSALQRWNFDVEAVADGESAWRALASTDQPTLAILDWVMPGIDGPEICRRVRADRSRPPTYILLLTSRGERADIVAGLDAGADDYLVKPFDSEELRARLQVGRRLLEALSRVIQLSGLLPICSYCKRVRSDDNYWEQVESYIAQHSNAVFSHGICPHCYEKLIADTGA